MIEMSWMTCSSIRMCLWKPIFATDRQRTPGHSFNSCRNCGPPSLVQLTAEACCASFMDMPGVGVLAYRFLRRSTLSTCGWNFNAFHLITNYPRLLRPTYGVRVYARGTHTHTHGLCLINHKSFSITWLVAHGVRMLYAAYEYVCCTTQTWGHGEARKARKNTVL